MRIKEIAIQNIKGIDSLSLKLGAVTVIRGENGAGKTSILDSIRTVFEGGHSPNLIRQGEKKGEVTLLLDDGTSIKKTITPKTSTLTITGADGLEIKPPMAFISKLASGFSFDPLRFVSAEPKKRAAFLLEAMPIEFAADEVKAAWPEYSGADLDLDGISALGKQIYEARKAANVAQRDSEGTVKTLQQALPEEDSTDWKAKVGELNAERLSVEQEISDAQAQVKATAVQEEQAVINEIADRIAALAQERSDRVEAIRQKGLADLRVIEETAAPEREQLSSETAVASERASAQAKAQGTREAIETTRRKIREHFIKSERFDKALKALGELQKRKLDSLPIEGVEVRDGDVYVNGLPFDDLNTAQQFTTAFQIAALKNGDLGFMIADKAEHLEGETTYKDFLEAAEGSGLQVLVARVEAGPRKIQVVA